MIDLFTAVTPDRPTRSLEELNASITMSQFERTIQVNEKNLTFQP